MKLEQAARQALEALESCNVGNWSMAFDEFAVVEAITALREALAEQAKQEPVAEVDYESVRFVTWLNGLPPQRTKLYAAPVRTKDLTDDEIMKINVDTASIVPTCDRQFHFARAVIAAYKEKNK